MLLVYYINQLLVRESAKSAISFLVFATFTGIVEVVVNLFASFLLIWILTTHILLLRLRPQHAQNISVDSIIRLR